MKSQKKLCDVIKALAIINQESTITLEIASLSLVCVVAARFRLRSDTIKHEVHFYVTRDLR